MGTATIVSSAGEGQYTINLDFGQDVLDARIANLNAQIARLDEELPTLEDSLATWEAEFTAAAAEQSSAISAYKLKLIGGEEGREERQAVEDATERLIIARITRDDIQQRVSRNQSSKISAQSRIDYYEGFNLTQTTSAWCADYTIDATGEVATIEVPGEPAAVLIVPGGDAPTAVDGNVVARIAQEAHQLYLNLAILPGWQKWAPTYRFGQITAIDREADTCEVELEAAESSEQNLDINQTSTLTDVPVEYMTCNSAAFEVFDDVVVKFESQSWENPKVIGFKDHPRPCAPARLFFLFQSPISSRWPYLWLDVQGYPVDTRGPMGQPVSGSMACGDEITISYASQSWGHRATTTSMSSDFTPTFQEFAGWQNSVRLFAAGGQSDLVIRFDVAWQQDSLDDAVWKRVAPVDAYPEVNDGTHVFLPASISGNAAIGAIQGGSTFGAIWQHMPTKTFTVQTLDESDPRGTDGGPLPDEIYGGMNWCYGTDTQEVYDVNSDPGGAAGELDKGHFTSWLSQFFELPSSVSMTINGKNITYLLEHAGPPPAVVDNPESIILPIAVPNTPSSNLPVDISQGSKAGVTYVRSDLAGQV